MTTFRNPPDVHPPVARYMHQAELDPAQRVLVLSGQIGMKADGDVPEDPLVQLELALENVLRNLRAAQMTPENLLKLTFYHVGQVDTDRRQAVVAEKLGSHVPCMTLLFVAGLASPKLKVEIDALASGPV